MRQLIRFVASLYPKTWQERYGAELGTLLEDVRPDWGTSTDVLKSALEMQMRALNFGGIFIAAGAVGVLVAAGVAFTLPRAYVSHTVLEMRGLAASGTSANDALIDVAERTLIRKSLKSIIDSETLPMEGGVERMKRTVRVFPIGNARFEIEFTYNDPYQARRVTQDMAESFMRASAQGGGPLTLGILDVADLPQKPARPNLGMIAAGGLGSAGGVALALILALKLRVSRRTA